jgi:hypothetical protein
MRPAARYCCALFVAALFLPAARAVERKAAGVVSQTNLGRIDSAVAVAGANVYNCDDLGTSDGGSMRVQVRSGQVYLASASEAQIQDGLNGVDVYIDLGTVGFSSMAGGVIELITPAGRVRPLNGQEASGQVTIPNPKEMVITAIRGDLVLDNGGQTRTIPQGQSAKVTFDELSEPACREDAGENQQPKNALQGRKIGFFLIPAGAAAIPAIILWKKLTESPSDPSN